MCVCKKQLVLLRCFVFARAVLSKFSANQHERYFHFSNLLMSRLFSSSSSSSCCGLWLKCFYFSSFLYFCGSGLCRLCGLIVVLPRLLQLNSVCGLGSNLLQKSHVVASDRLPVQASFCLLCGIIFFFRFFTMVMVSLSLFLIVYSVLLLGLCFMYINLLVFDVPFYCFVIKISS